MRNLVVCLVVVFLVVAIVPKVQAAEGFVEMGETSLIQLALADVTKKMAVEAEKPEPTVTATIQTLSKYVDDNGAKYVNGAVIQSTFGLNLFGGAWAEVFNSQSLRSSETKELDFTLGVTKEFFGAEFEIGISYIDLERLMTFEEGDLWRMYASVKKEFKIPDTLHSLTPFLKVQWYLPVKGDAAEEKGVHVFVGVEHATPLSKDAKFSQKITFAYDDGAIGYDRAGIFFYEIGIEAKLFGPVSIMLGERITTPFTHVNDGRRFESIPSIGLKFEL